MTEEYQTQDPADDRQDPEKPETDTKGVMLCKLREAIYDYHESGTHENAQTVAQLKDLCIVKYGAKATRDTVQAALCLLHKRHTI